MWTAAETGQQLAPAHTAVLPQCMNINEPLSHVTE